MAIIGDPVVQRFVNAWEHRDDHRTWIALTKGYYNALSDTVVSTATLGMVELDDNPLRFPVTDQDHEFGYGATYFGTRVLAEGALMIASCPQPNSGRTRCRINAVGIAPPIWGYSRFPENSGEGCGAAAGRACAESAHAHAIVLAICGDGAWVICGRWMDGRRWISGVGVRIRSTSVRVFRRRRGSRTPSSAADRYC